MVITALELAGVFVFGLSGGVLATRKRMDVFGVLVLAVVTALGGGVMRDLLIGVHPVSALHDWRYLACAGGAGLVAFVAHDRFDRVAPAVRVFDAAGLALFTVSGTARALALHLGGPQAALLGMLTGVGGGALRDVLAGEIPLVLRREIYAVASLAGAALVVSAHHTGLPVRATYGVAALVTFALRMISVRRGWNAPTARPHRAEAVLGGELDR